MCEGAPLKAGEARPSTYSIREQFDGAVVLLTGASGYVGSLVLEQLLRTTRVARVLLLLRAKRGQEPAARVRDLLKSGLFHHVRNRPELVSKVAVVAGDISQPGLGLSAEDRELLLSSVHIVLHSAASIELEADIHATLRSNYMGARCVAELAADCAHLRSLVHVSSAYVNIHRPRHSVVHEKVYGLTFGDQSVDAEGVAQELLALPNAAANERAQVYITRWGFPNTYCLGKHLTEEMLVDLAAATGVPLAIVRPSFVTSVAHQPYPGYVGNWAGPLGLGAALAVGLVPSRSMLAGQPHSVWDAMPGDLVASAILAAGAAVAAGAADAVAAAAAAARAAGGGDVAPPPLAPPAVPSPAAAAAAAAAAAPVVVRAVASPPGAAAAAAAGVQRARGCQPLVVHACSTTTYPVTAIEAYNTALDFIRAHPAPLRISVGELKRMREGWQPRPRAVRRWMRWTELKVGLLDKLLRAVGQGKQAKRLTVGFRALEVQNHEKGDRDLWFATHTLVALQEAMAQHEAADYMLVWRAHPAVEGPKPRPSGLVDGAGGKGACGTGGGGDAGAAVTFSDEISWRRYTFTVMAGIYRMFFGVDVPSGRDGVDHDFVFIK